MNVFPLKRIAEARYIASPMYIITVKHSQRRNMFRLC